MMANLQVTEVSGYFPECSYVFGKYLWLPCGPFGFLMSQLARMGEGMDALEQRQSKTEKLLKKALMYLSGLPKGSRRNDFQDIPPFCLIKFVWMLSHMCFDWFSLFWVVQLACGCFCLF